MVPKVWGSLHNAAAELQCSCCTAATFCLSLFKMVSFFPLTFSLSLSQTCLLLPAVFSPPYINLQFISLIHPRSLWLSFPHLSLLQCLEVSQKRGTRRAQTEGGKELERLTMTPVWPVTTTAGKCVFSSCFHLGVGRENALREHALSRVLCCQQSTNYFSKVHNLAKFGQIFLDIAKLYIPASKASSCQISNLYHFSWWMQALQK